MQDMVRAGRSEALQRGAEDAPGRGAGDWRRRAACRGEDPELFFPVSPIGLAMVQIAEGKKACGRCPVRAACLQYAMVTGQEYGIWGGLTEDERRQLRRGPQNDGELKDLASGNVPIRGHGVGARQTGPGAPALASAQAALGRYARQVYQGGP